jgi:high-affinity Fe2+/Pb2+ permease
MLTSFVNLISKVTDAESFRIITLAMLLAIGMMFLYGFRHLEGRIDKTHSEVNTRINAIERSVIPRNEFMQMERRLDSYFEQLDKRLDRIEAKL